jgi:PAS domain S-box-containing protein
MQAPPELDLEERAALFEAIHRAADGAGIGLAITEVSQQPRNLFVNAGLARTLGCSVTDLYQKSVWSFIAPEELPRLQELARLRGEGKNPPTGLEITLLHASGRRVQAEVFQSHATLNGRAITVSFVSDISARAAATQALRESEKRFRDVVENAPDGVAILRGPAILFLNPRASAMLGLPHRDAGNGRLIMEFLHPEDRERAATRIRRLLEEGALEDRAEYRSIDARGEEHTVEISSIPIEFGGGPAVLAFARDVTERRRLQNKLLEADRLAALGVLSAGVAHEINNPLAYVLLNLEYLKRELPRAAGDPARVAELMVRVQDACHGADRVASIVRDLRTFARGDESTRRPVDVQAALEGAINIAYPEIRQRAQLERIYAAVPLVDGNAGRLEQVFLNLLLNAVQAFPKDRASGENQIRITLRSTPEQVVIEVSDNGPGILPEHLGRIFDPFFTTKPVGVGTGLGLPICRGIVQTHGGEIEVETKPGGGACFRVRLPASKQAEAERQETPVRSERTHAAERGRILIVDDERVVAQALKMLLQGEHDLVIVENALEALEHLRHPRGAQGFDAVLCDLMMPGMTGMELFDVIKREDPQLAARVVFMTGGVSMHGVADFLERVPNRTLEKPFDVAELRRTLQSLVARSRGLKSPPAALRDPPA